jgi:hypothetical protein
VGSIIFVVSGSGSCSPFVGIVHNFISRVVEGIPAVRLAAWMRFYEDIGTLGNPSPVGNGINGHIPRWEVLIEDYGSVAFRVLL